MSLILMVEFVHFPFEVISFFNYMDSFGLMGKILKFSQRNAYISEHLSLSIMIRQYNIYTPPSSSLLFAFLQNSQGNVNKQFLLELAFTAQDDEILQKKYSIHSRFINFLPPLHIQ